LAYRLRVSPLPASCAGSWLPRAPATSVWRDALDRETVALLGDTRCSVTVSW